MTMRIAIALFLLLHARSTKAQQTPTDSIAKRAVHFRVVEMARLLSTADHDTVNYLQALTVFDSLDKAEWTSAALQLRFVSSVRLAGHRLLRVWATGECRDARGAKEMLDKADRWMALCDLCRDPPMVLEELRRFGALHEPIQKAVAQTCH